MRVGTIVKYNNHHLGIFLYPHEVDLEENTLCSVLNRWTKRIIHLQYREIEEYENICLFCGQEIFNDERKDGIYIFDIEGWYEFNGVNTLLDENDYLVKVDNAELIYKGDIKDCLFEIYVEELIDNGLEPILVIDLINQNKFIYALDDEAIESKEIIKATLG